MSFMGFFRGVNSFFGTTGDVINILNGTTAERMRKEKALEQRLDNLSLTCRKCNGLARPIRGTYNRYSCECGQRFAGSRHGF